MRLKHLYIILPLLCAAGAGRAQTNKPILSQTSPAGSASNASTPAEVNTTGDISYIRSYVPLIPITDTADVNTGNQPGLIRQQTAYLDGFMRPYQTVTRNAANVNGQARHLVNIAYNYPAGEQRSYLPYAAGSSGVQSNAFQAQQTYYSGLYPNEGYTGFSKTKNTSDAGQYSVTDYAPGKSQVGQDRGTVLQNISNAANEILIWDWDEGSGMPVASGYYAAKQLFGKQMTGPFEGAAYTATQSKTYTDKDGRLILKMEAADYTLIPPSTYVSVYNYTYYVYDAKGNLRCTITPKAFKYYQDNSGALSTDVVKNLCFLYQYDDKGRLTVAQKPGEDGFTYMVYDAKDRPVMRQTPNERLENKWEVTFYDVLNRVKASSVFADNANAFNRDQWQGELDGAAVNGATGGTIPYYIGTAAGEAEYPDDNISDNTMMAYTYYDDYNTVDPSGSEWDNLNNQLNFTEMVSSPGSEMPERSMNVYGAVTGSMVRILPAPDADASKTGDWRKSVIFYDSKGRATYSGSSDLYQGNVIHFNLSGTQYDFANRMLLNKHAWYNANSADAVQGHTELTKYTYDGTSGALLDTKHQVDGGTWNAINTFTYDDLGRVKRKSLGGGGEVQDMGYNIRGQLTGINGTYAETGNKENYSRTFGESIKYDYGFDKNRIDGKMAGMIWRGSDADQMLAYGYEYTRNQLLQSADFNYIKNSNWIKNDMDYSVSGLKYDENGNITDMAQRGTKPVDGPVNMDILHYTYQQNSNRLNDVVDNGGVADYGAGDFQDNPAEKDYTYDPNGNLTTDANKGISQTISYTFFNKPVNITTGNGNTFAYSYDAAGGKVQEILADQQTGTVVTDYIGNAVYENDSLKYILTADGRTVFQTGVVLPVREEFFVKDHLGNVRSTINVTSSMPRDYLADYEIASANLENLIFDNIDELREVKPGGDEDNSMAAKLNGRDAAKSVGSALLLHVMAGDRVNMKVNDYYDYYDPEHDSTINADDMIANVITALSGGYNGFEGENHNTKLVGDIFNGSNSSFYNEIVQSQTDLSKPRAYLNYVMFDEHMNIVSGSSGAFQAEHEGGWGLIGTTEAMEMPVNGYIAVYLSNRTVRDVYFDRLQVEVIKGNLLQENHYYPHGLPIKGLGSDDRDLMAQRRKYQSNEYIRSGLDWMSFGARQYDPQIGRFLSVDPLAAFGGQDRYSPYAAMGNQPESAVDPNGLLPDYGRFAQFTKGGAGLGPDGSGIASESWLNGGGGAMNMATMSGMDLDPLMLFNAQRAFNVMVAQIQEREQQQQVYSTINGNLSAGGINYKIENGKWAKVFPVGCNISWKNPFEEGNLDGTIGGRDSDKKNGSSSNKSISSIGLTVSKFVAYDNGESGGVIIDLGYKDPGTGYSDFQWVQTIWTDKAAKGTNSPYNDPYPGDDNLPFYYTSSEMKAHTNKDGFDLTFHDNPVRDFGYKDATWRGELSLVGKKGMFYYPIVTISYGFQITNGELSSISAPQIITPSSFGVNSFMYRILIKPLSIYNFFKN
ncbi:hypothetical protein F0919_03835 [Taibaiella lutea]|uniref:DUF6443 domain-containing protein n=1 Tax=Taibaiella lutea TaxID=2608001 RepID=A0A5M6CNM1_9BACT|nr:RHS repeat-associated core domain-containing protein [Taibaiella lutea]KAA5536811.1 hypothetical protein F0919_03835 [Taibaiella lutea]